MPQLNRWWAVCGLAMATLGAWAIVPAKSEERVLYSFCSQQGCADGAAPESPLITDKARNFYGTTYFGGQVTNDCANYGAGCGTIFKLAPDGIETVLYAFAGPDGGNPVGGLIKDSAGDLFGTTIVGGTGTSGSGTVFKLASNGTESVLHSFQGGSDGSDPVASLIMDRRGNLFGTTLFGGSSTDCNGNNNGCGTVFEIGTSGHESILYAFQGGSDGGVPVAGVVAHNGNLYGATSLGGIACEGFTRGCGTVFDLAPDGTETVLHTFVGGSDGADPWGSLLVDKNGNFYGTTIYGGAGAGCNCGTIFKVAPDGTETVLYAFQGGSDGAYPYAGLIADGAGNLYGTTSGGGGREGGYRCKRVVCGGTVFKLAPDGTETILYAFRKNHGSSPQARLLMGKRGALYGTATLGAANNEGAVFRVSP